MKDRENQGFKEQSRAQSVDYNQQDNKNAQSPRAQYSQDQLAHGQNKMQQGRAEGFDYQQENSFSSDYTTSSSNKKNPSKTKKDDQL